MLLNVLNEEKLYAYKLFAFVQAFLYHMTY